MEDLSKKKSLIILICIGLLVIGCSVVEAYPPYTKINNVNSSFFSSNQGIIKKINEDLRYAPSAAGGQKYYVCDTGDDNNSGLSEEFPFKTHYKAMEVFGTVDAGGSVLFCRGGVFQVTAGRAIDNMACNISAPCTLADYGDPSAKRPLIVDDGSNINPIWFADGGKKSPDGGYIVKNLMLVSTGGSAVGVFLYRGVNNIVFDNILIDGFRLGVQIAGGSVHNVTLRNSVVRRSRGQGILGACDDCLFEGNYFENNGSTRFHHNIYLSSNDDPLVTNMVVKGNTLYKSAIDTDGSCVGVSLGAHGKFEGLTIENNYIKEDIGKVKGGCYGISIDPGYAYEEFFRNVLIRGNVLLNVGGNAIGCASCDGVVIENNIIIGTDPALVHGISVPVSAEDSVKSRGVVIQNNKILLGRDWNQSSGIRVLSSMTVVNNAINLPDYPLGMCVRDLDENIDIGPSSNTCTSTVSASTIGAFAEQMLKDAFGEITPEEITPEEITPEEITPEEITPEEITPEEITPEEITPEKK